ncbi:MAG: SDR family NAD(P)-dependent oxidoreductase [Myxococcales bacterium]
MAERVLILGATSAIAQEIAAVYAQRGARLYLVGRNPQKLQNLTDRLAVHVAGGGAAAPSENKAAVVGTVAVDLNETALAPLLVSGAIAALGGLDVAVIAHGLLGDQRGTEREFHQAEEVIATNFLSVVALLIPLANHLEASGEGHLAVLSSVAGERGRPRNYTYGAAKGALNVYLQGVRSRLGARGVRVHTIKLGPVDTPMTADHKKTLLFARAPRVAAAVVRAIDRGRGEVFVPWFWRGIMMIVRALPELFFRRIRALSGR